MLNITTQQHTPSRGCFGAITASSALHADGDSSRASSSCSGAETAAAARSHMHRAHRYSNATAWNVLVDGGERVGCGARVHGKGVIFLSTTEFIFADVTRGGESCTHSHFEPMPDWPEQGATRDKIVAAHSRSSAICNRCANKNGGIEAFRGMIFVK